MGSPPVSRGADSASTRYSSSHGPRPIEPAATASATANATPASPKWRPGSWSFAVGGCAREAYASRVATRPRHKRLALILAREFASNLSTPTLIADDEGRLMFFNEAAAEVVGRSSDEVGEVPLDEWISSFSPRTRDAEPLAPEERPARIALDQRRAAHQRYWVTSRDGIEREVSVSAFPLFAHADEFIGIVSMFWREE